MNFSALARADLPHKVLRQTVNLAFQDSKQLRARTINVSRFGITMMCPLQIAKGSICKVEFDIPLDGEIRKVIAVSRTHDCVCVGTQGFRTGLRFLQIEAQYSQAIDDLLQYAF